MNNIMSYTEDSDTCYKPIKIEKNKGWLFLYSSPRYGVPKFIKDLMHLPTKVKAQ